MDSDLVSLAVGLQGRHYVESRLPPSQLHLLIFTTQLDLFDIFFASPQLNTLLV